MAGSSDLGGAAHLVKRFFGSFRRTEHSPEERSRVLDCLSPAELAHFSEMSAQDQAHGIGGGLYVLDEHQRPDLVPAAAMHDVGKTEANLNTVQRVMANLIVVVAGRERASRLKGQVGLIGRLGAYCNHPNRGAELLRDAGSTDQTIAWAQSHHSVQGDERIGTIEREILAEADKR